MTQQPDYGRVLACGCPLGYERCFDCRPGLHPDQETALAMTLQPDDREALYERINALEDILGSAMAYLDGDPQYRNAKDGLLVEIKAYFDERRRDHDEAGK